MTYTYTNTNKWTAFTAVTESGATVPVRGGETITLDERVVETPRLSGDEFAPAVKTQKKSRKKSD